ncbi:Olfactomedin-like protein 2B [Aphelenchoides bicaudatus]|nr:Olfactomedin-like protein 2B [Aphelenchoides bicaudatus]
MASKQRLIFWTLFGAQVLNLFLIVGLYGHAYFQLKVRFNFMNFNLFFKRVEQCKQVPLREKRDASQDLEPEKPVESLSEWAILIGEQTIIPKHVFELSCRRVHRYCSDRSMKLRGFQGPPGPIGSHGPTEVGEEGPRGKDGRCNCTFPDLYVQRIAVPGPPIIQVNFASKIKQLALVLGCRSHKTRVPFEPTPPGYAPPDDWKPGMPMPDLTRTKILPRPTPPQPGLAKPPRRKLIGSGRRPRPYDNQETTMSPDEQLRLLNESIAFNETMLQNLTETETTPESYTGAPTLGYSQRECRLNAVGIPVLHAESQYGKVGSWHRDVNPQTQKMEDKRWVTDDFASPVLYEYENERQLMNKKQNIKYYVDYLASGTGSLIYNGSYFYHRHGSNFLVRYNLESAEQIQSNGLGELSTVDCARKHDHSFEKCNETQRDFWLYNRAHNYVDYAADENGLWIMYMRPDEERLIVSKIEPDFYIVQTWELDVNGTDLADAFIMCGVLYGLESTTERDTYISYAFDLYNNRTLDVDIPWYNPYRGLTMLHYNPVDGRLYFFDAGKLLSVNVRIEDSVDEPPPQEEVKKPKNKKVN